MDSTAKMQFRVFRDNYGRLSGEDLTARLAGAFLLLNRLPENEDDRSLRDFDTALGGDEGVMYRALLETQVCPIRSREKSNASGLISLGRAPTNDVVLAHESVSKVHAYFLPEEGGKYLFWDAGSRNGTFLGPRQLVANKREELAPGSTLRFGQAYSGTFHTAASLVDFLNFTRGMLGES